MYEMNHCTPSNNISVQSLKTARRKKVTTKKRKSVVTCRRIVVYRSTFWWSQHKIATDACARNLTPVIYGHFPKTLLLVEPKRLLHLSQILAVRPYHLSLYSRVHKIFP